jgi:hypothetical protein
MTLSKMTLCILPCLALVTHIQCYAGYRYMECCYAECCSALCYYIECHYSYRYYAECRYTDCHNAECRYTDCHYAEYQYAEVFLLSKSRPIIVKLGVIVLDVSMLIVYILSVANRSVIILNVVAPKKQINEGYYF